MLHFGKKLPQQESDVYAPRGKLIQPANVEEYVDWGTQVEGFSWGFLGQRAASINFADKTAETPLRS